MKITGITTTEEMVMNPDYKGLRSARIEVFVEGEHYPRECGRIEVHDDDEFFSKLRDLIEDMNSMYFDECPDCV